VCCDSVDVAFAVDRLQHQVQELRELDRLAVDPAYEERGHAVARAAHLPDQLEIVGTLQGILARVDSRAGRVAGRLARHTAQGGHDGLLLDL
jgi:hypothetical protein